MQVIWTLLQLFRVAGAKQKLEQYLNEYSCVPAKLSKQRQVGELGYGTKTRAQRHLRRNRAKATITSFQARKGLVCALKEHKAFYPIDFRLLLCVYCADQAKCFVSLRIAFQFKNNSRENPQQQFQQLL